ncbi:hypothetical protein [Hazenella coriacea]|uniref:WD40 repeat protein n=1 Tax=Hazenella coriacea TaxID=1179467 RepID=A0A4R3L080_9BACL|nr:hypothetical protein [Hazenella coriacea]TCS92604.1 hypothetical protein EDD58_11168 [Hazenella coriacea]
MFTTKDPKGHTQLFQFDRVTNKRTQLTKEFLNVDTLRFDQKNDKVYMRVLLPGHRNFHLGTFDLNTHQTAVWNPSEDDQSIVYFDYNAFHNQIATLTKSVKEDYEKVSRANETQTPLEPSTKQINLITIDSKKSKQISTIKKFIQDISISPKGTNILFTASGEFTQDAKKTMYRLNLKSGKYTPLLSDSTSFSKLNLAQYSPDEKNIYFIATPKPFKWITDQGGREIKVRAIYGYNMETKEISKIWYKEDGYINHFLLL